MSSTFESRTAAPGCGKTCGSDGAYAVRLGRAERNSRSSCSSLHAPTGETDDAGSR